MRLRLCVRLFRAESNKCSWTICLREHQAPSSSSIFSQKLQVARTSESLLVIDTRVECMHARTAEEIYVNVPSGIKSSKFGRLKAAVNGTRKASKQCQDSSDKLVKSMLFQQSDINPRIYRRFSDNLDLEQHGDDFLVCGLSSDLECLGEEFKKHFVVKKAEIMSLRHEHQKETHFLKRRICVDDFAWHVELHQRYVESLLDAQGKNHCNSMATPGSKEQERHAASDKLDPKEHQEFRSGAGICQYMTEQHCDIAFSTKEIHEGCSRTNHILNDEEENNTLPQRPSALCIELGCRLAGDPKTKCSTSGGCQVGRHHPCDCGCRLDWRPTRCSTSGGVLAIGPCFTVRQWSVGKTLGRFNSWPRSVSCL